MTLANLQNRVDPWGQLHSVPDRGTLMGNRGILHNEAREIVRPWARKPWVSCLLSYKSEKRELFSNGNYSELFFLDEATSLAAGHRPCKTCQRDRHINFKNVWLQANKPAVADFVPISEIDNVLHAERAKRGGGKQTFDAVLSELPVGTIFEYKKEAFLVQKHALLRWSFDGYSAADSIPQGHTVVVLTPQSIVRMFSLGYVPGVHSSAELA
jgi:hypothetical protein